MKTLVVLVSVASISGAILLLGRPAAANCPAVECQNVKVCTDHVYPCGENRDGTVIFCIEQVCELVEVCHQVPCRAEPDPTSPGLDPGPVLPTIPSLPRPIPFE